MANRLEHLFVDPKAAGRIERTLTAADWAILFTGSGAEQEGRRRTADLQARAGSKGALAGMLDDLRQFGG